MARQVWSVRIPQVPLTCPECGHREHYLNGGYGWPQEGVVHACTKCGAWIDPEDSYPADGRGRSRSANYKGSRRRGRGQARGRVAPAPS